MRGRFVMAMALGVVLAACGGDDKGGGGNSSGGGGSAPPTAKGTPWTPEQLAALTAVDVPGYERKDGTSAPTDARWSYTRETPTEGGATLTIRVHAGTCADPSLCVSTDPTSPMNSGYAKQSKAALEARGMKDPTVKLTSVDLPGGRKGMRLWTRGYAEKPSAVAGVMDREVSQLMSIRWTDSSNGVELVATVMTKGEIKSREEFEKTMPEEDTLTALIEVFGTLARAFPK